MKVIRLAVQNVRIHNVKTVDFELGTTLISGPNGCGKTSLIEALYIALRGKSFRGGDESICSRGQTHYRIDVATDDIQYRVNYQQRDGQKTKQFIVDGKKHGRLPYSYKYPIVLFEPDTLRIIHGSPQRRRDFIDNIIQQFDPVYSQELARYNRALLQRNKLLKDATSSDDDLFSWNIILSDYGARIIDKRQAILLAFNQSITQMYRSIAGNDDTVEVTYSHASKLSSQRLLKEYESRITHDRTIGATSVGPHRHDFIINFNGESAAKVASRGEARTIVLALKFLEASYIQQQTNKAPLILLDDVFGELDPHRQERLLSEFIDNQIIMTSANAE